MLPNFGLPSMGNAELMCIALNRADRMIKDIAAKRLVAATVPDEVDTILPALTVVAQHKCPD